MNFHKLFDHIWTNLLTQCTSVSVPVFCCFCIAGFPTIKNAPKTPEKLYKKSAQRNLPESPKEGRRDPPGPQAPWWRRPGEGRARGAPGSLEDPLADPLCLYIAPDEETPNIEVLFP